MKSLFFRTFVASWLATLLISVCFAFIYVGQETDHYWKDWHALHRDAFAPRVQRALAGMATQTPDDLGALIQTLESEAIDLRVYAVVARDRPQDDLPLGVQNMGELAVSRGALADQLDEDAAYFAVPVVNEFPGTALVGQLKRPSMLFWYVDPDTLPLRLLVLMTVLALFCYGLSRPLSRRLRTIRHSSQQLAAGNLAVRIGRHVEEPDDEATALARDFDHMAERLSERMVSQQRLRSDLLDELRSPLERLIAALDLAPDDRADTCPLYRQRVALEAHRLRELIDRAEHPAPSDTEPEPSRAARTATVGG